MGVHLFFISNLLDILEKKKKALDSENPKTLKMVATMLRINGLPATDIEKKYKELTGKSISLADIGHHH